jgi:hypothetical protein
MLVQANQLVTPLVSQSGHIALNILLNNNQQSCLNNCTSKNYISPLMSLKAHQSLNVMLSPNSKIRSMIFLEETAGPAYP